MKLTRPLAVASLVAASVLIAVPASATNAGQYCEKTDAGTVTKAHNGDKIRCSLDSTDNRYHWVALSADDDASVPAADADLAETGATASTPYVVGAAALMLTGGGYLALRRRRQV